MTDQRLTIGKDKSCDIAIGGRYTAGEHARLLVLNGVVSIEDLNSQFGTFVNAEKIEKPRVLKPKDKVKIGTQLFDWEAYSEGVEVAIHDPNPVYFKDLFTFKGTISKSNYRFILLFFAVSPLLISFGVPSLILITGKYKAKKPNLPRLSH